MAGRGRGRGRTVSFNVEALGINRGDALPGPILQPPPLFPSELKAAEGKTKPQEFKPVPLRQGEDYEYICALKKEFIGFMKKSPYYIQSNEKRKDIERYSDKYQNGQDTLGQWTPDWRIFPEELKPKEKKVRKYTTSRNIKPNISPRKKMKDINKTLEKLEKKEAALSEQEDDDDEEKDEGEKTEKKTEEDLDDIADDIEEEEETDYILTYFDNGENYGDDDDDDDGDGPIY